MKSDIKKTYKELYDVSIKHVSEVNVPEFKFIMIDGVGNPTVPDFALQSKALNLISHSIRNELKEMGKGDYLIAPLQGLWDTYDNSKFDVTRKRMIRYTLMIPQPEAVTEELFNRVKEELLIKRDDEHIRNMYFKPWREGPSVQMLHIGPYNTEIITTKLIMEYIIIQNMKLNGLHHEIYLNNPERVKPEKLKTIVRYSVIEDC